MRHILICLCSLFCTAILNCSEPPVQTKNPYLDPATFTVDKDGHEGWYKKIDGHNQYQRNHRQKRQYWARKKSFQQIKKEGISLIHLAAEQLATMQSYGKKSNS